LQGAIVERPTDCSPRPAANQPANTLDRIRQSLFAETVPPDGEPDSSLDYFSAAGESLECVEIARRIRKSAADGVAFDRMAILLRSPERYQPLVEEALRRAGIPAYFSRGVARPDPAGRAFLALLACAGEGCSATRFAEYLSLGQAPPLDRPPGAAPPRRCRRMTKCSRDCTSAPKPMRRRPSPRNRRKAKMPR
jgi:ATP-dependent helicase/nuclease subunit B